MASIKPNVASNALDVSIKNYMEIMSTIKPDVDIEKGGVEKPTPDIVSPNFPASADEMLLVTELIFAASQNDVKTMERLLELVSPNTGDYDRRTALHVAASEGSLDAVKLLISKGASVNVADRWGETPLDDAAKYGRKEVGSYLLTFGALYDGNITALHLIQAVSDGDSELVSNILAIGFDPNVADYDGRTPLHIAVAVGNVGLAKLLIEKGADPLAVDRFGGTPMSDAQAKAPRFGPDKMRDFLALNGGRDFKDIDDDNSLDIGVFLAVIQSVFFVLYGVFVEYGGTAAGVDPEGAMSEMTKYPQYQDVHVMIFIGFGMLMLFLKKYAYSALTYNFMLAIVVIQWHILVNGFFHNAFEGTWKKIELSLTTFVLADFACAVVLITFGAILGKVTKPTQLVLIALLEIVFFSINENIGLKLHISDIGGSMVVHIFGAYFGLGVSYILCPFEARAHGDNSANYTSDVFSMVGSIFLWMMWPSFNSALAGPYDQERVVINTVLALTASGVGAFASSWIMRGQKKFDMVDIQNASIAGGVAVGTTANMMLGPFGAQLIGFAAGCLSVAGYVFIQPFLERKMGVYDTCGVHNLHGMPGVLAGVAGIVVAAIATTSRYNTEANYEAVFYHNEPGMQAGMQAAFLFLTLGMAMATGLLTGLIARATCGRLQPRVYNDDRFFENAFR